MAREFAIYLRSISLSLVENFQFEFQITSNIDVRIAGRS